MDAFESLLIGQALTQASGSVSEAAERLAIPKKTLYDKIKKHGLSRLHGDAPT
jgi:two-component system C4-dicarboxylate transport response regulator DctD